MDKSSERNESKIFISNMVESSIRIGLIFVLFMFTYDIIRPFILPVIWGAIIAVALLPVTKRLQRAYGGRRGLAATTIALLGIALLVTPLVMVSGSIYDGATHALQVLQSGDVKIPGPKPSVADWPLVGGKLYDTWTLFSTNLEQAIQTFMPQIKSALTSLLGMMGGALGSVLLSILSLAIAAGFMTYSESLASGLTTIAIRTAGDNAKSWATLIAATIKSVLLGVVGVAAIQALLIGAGFFVFGVPAAGLLTLILMILCIAQLPALLAVLPVIGYMYMTQDSTTATLFTVWAVVGALSENLLKPMLMGRGVDTPMPIILIGAIGGMLVYGIVGLFLGAVILSIWYELFVWWLSIEKAQQQEELGDLLEEAKDQSESENGAGI
ncbi:MULTISPECIES: AI-2E family transporter [Vibrio]|uniref:AI-2E family transporter n=1 Tax=Vibrio natriegens NBRC 15636 = ATCC 14048 = DSM 759 TaxID=1219067 RepID=A0AAN0Y6Z2_VIBNA|nr:AI-2E family transporter [Vibrio natriegens]MEE3877470.1 AI-2E family transporter [Vibrio sp. YYF0003]ALR17400.1 hipothetical membrane protein [Vibrio natriegens NBRC 15636 = ATCC 14048 = DSM 759]ANQ14891.1 AI-2E family transporter [Vibrio natriegens NBRC 15636 = ATCC 14048 = DSM 759]EPM41985.1 hipothetical membrane protein [Vibrio natriegens NBRC 15636 = ATCC 14048 = DSM 759]MDX6029785.1 AI-2E family transporter [Vibrio natriegens NBRC 15636 = ATCC 14048 = DSM 759]